MHLKQLKSKRVLSHCSVIQEKLLLIKRYFLKFSSNFNKGLDSSEFFFNNFTVKFLQDTV